MRQFIDSFLEPALWFAADWSLRWAALLAVVALVLWIFRPRRAAIRQTSLLVALIAGLLLPIAPRWGVGWERYPFQEPSSSFPDSGLERTVRDAPLRASPRKNTTPQEDATPKQNARQSLASSAFPGGAWEREEPPSEPLGVRRLLVVGLVSCWLCVVVYQLMRCLGGRIYLRQLWRESLEVAGATGDHFAACRAELGVRGMVRLATHPRVRSPVLFGWLRPWIVVPPDWPQRSAQSQRAGLLHELAHVRRRDHLLAPLLEIVRIAFIFHPLVRWLLARLEYQREILCDEMVVRLGIDRRDYARLLFEFARSSGRLAWPAVSLPMSRRRTVKGRIHHLLEEDMERWIQPFPARWAIVLASVLMALSLGLTSYRVWAEDKDKAETPAKKAEQQPPSDKPAASQIKREDLRYGGKDFYQWRRDLLTELKPSIRADGMRALGTFGAHGYGAEATQAILDMMRDYDPAIENSPDEDAPVVGAAYQAILKIGAAAVPTLAVAVKDENRKARRFALEALGRMASDAQPALPALLQAIKNDDPETRTLAIYTVGMTRRGTKEVVAALIDALNDKTDGVRASAADALGNLGESAKPAIPALLKALSDKGFDARSNAISALNQIGAGAKAVPAISRLLQDEVDNNIIRDSAFNVLEKLKPEEIKEAVPALIAALKDGRWEYRAINLLAKIGPAAKEAVPALNELLRSDNAEERKRAIEALKKISPDDKR